MIVVVGRYSVMACRAQTASTAILYEFLHILTTTHSLHWRRRIKNPSIKSEIFAFIRRTFKTQRNRYNNI